MRSSFWRTSSVVMLSAARRRAEEIRVREQRLLEESEALRTQSEADLEIELAARREEAERDESERHAAAAAATRKLVEEAERRAATAEAQAASLTARNEEAMREADERARQIVADALGCTEACIRRWILLRRVSSYRVGRLVRIAESEVQRILREGFVPARESRQ